LARIQERFETQSGTTFTKEETDAGNVRYRKDGTFTSSQSFAAGKSHTALSEVKRGNTKPSELDADDLNAPYDAASYTPAELFDDDSFEREQRVNRNQFNGFLNAEATPEDRVEAAFEYQQFLKQMEKSNSPEQDRKIKKKYGLGGS
jgi:hypothetical protein